MNHFYIGFFPSIYFGILHFANNFLNVVVFYHLEEINKEKTQTHILNEKPAI